MSLQLETYRAWRHGWPSERAVEIKSMDSATAAEILIERLYAGAPETLTFPERVFVRSPGGALSLVTVEMEMVPDFIGRCIPESEAAHE